VFGFGNHSGARYAWSLIYWHQDNAAAGKTRTILGPFLWDKTPDAWTSALPPLWVAWRRGETRRYFAPLFYHTDDATAGTAFNVFGPLYFGKDPHGHSAGLIPLLFTRTHDDGRWSVTLLPLFSAAKKGDGSRLLTLLFGYSTTASGTLGFVGPVYFRKELTGWSAALIPIAYHTHDTLDGSSLSIILPLYFRRATPEKTLTAITPLIWHYRTVETATTVAFPLFFDHNAFGESRTTGFLPLFIRHVSTPSRSSSWIVPPLLLYVGASPEGRDVVFFPLVWRMVGEGGARTTVAFPLFWDFKRGEATTQVLFPLYMRASRHDADYTLVLNTYVRRGKGEAQGSIYVNVFPFFSWGRPRPQDLEWDILGGAVGYARIGTTRTLKLFYALEVPLAPANVTLAPPTGSFFTATTSHRELF
jgi:hypothetical protein